MNLRESWKKFLDKYMRSVNEKIDVAEFQADEIRRYRIVFSGLVQGVGFRYEVWTFAQKLQLTGYVENLPNETVYAEIQGSKNRIKYLIECLESIPRIHIEKMQMDEMPLKEEVGFEILN